MAERNYDFIRRKYREFFLPTLLMVLSEKICSLVDVFIMTFFLESSVVSATTISSPFIYFMGIFYILFGQGGSILALRAKSHVQREKANYYFTFAVFGMILTSVMLVIFIFVFADQLVYFFNTPTSVFQHAKDYLLIISLFLPLNAYIVVLSYFIRSDGFPKLTFYTILISNILNLIFDIIFIAVLNMGVGGAALASVFGYLVGAIFITLYYFRQTRGFYFVSHSINHINEIFTTLKEILLNTPEVIGKIFFVAKITVLTYLSATYLGAAGLIAFLVYDNSETFVYMFLSGIMKTMSPIVTVFYKETDYDAVIYVIKRSIKELFFILLPIVIFFVIYPDIFLVLFNIHNPHYAHIVKLAIRITSLGLMGRCFTYLFANYAQATEQNRVVAIIFSLNEFIIPIFGGILLTHFIGGLGIWIAITLGEAIPLALYALYRYLITKDLGSKLNEVLALEKSDLFMLTYYRKNIGISESTFDEESKEVLDKIGEQYTDFIKNFGYLVNDICMDIFDFDPDLEQIDITVKFTGEMMLVSLTGEGKVYNSLRGFDFYSRYHETFKNYDCEFEYDQVLGFNKFYIKAYPK